MTSSLANISSPAFINRIGMGSKKIIHRMVFVRHGETIANQHMMKQSFDPEKKFLNTPLSTLGVHQAHDVSNYLIDIGFIPDKIIVSRLTRAVNTAKPFIEKSCIPVLYSEKLVEYNHSNDEIITDDKGNWNYKKETREEFIARVSNSFEEISKECDTIPKQTLIFTHSQVISSILTNSVFKITDITNVFFHLANGSITCIDIDEDYKYHIQCVNYTKHLVEPTGQHSPFV